MSRIVVVGGHGKVALLLAPLLVQAGHEVVSVIRNPDHAPDVEATGATPVVADVEAMDESALADLVRGHDAIVWSAGAGGGSPERTYAVDRDAAIRTMDAARTAGTARFVMVSYMGAGPDHGVDPDNSFWHYAEAKAAADAHLRETDLAWTILGPNRLTEDPATGRIETGGTPTSDHVSRSNVARVVAAVLETPGTVGRQIEFADGDTPIAEAIA